MPCFAMLGVFFVLFGASPVQNFPAVTWILPPLRYPTSPPALQKLLDRARTPKNSTGSTVDLSVPSYFSATLDNPVDSDSEDDQEDRLDMTMLPFVDLDLFSATAPLSDATLTTNTEHYLSDFIPLTTSATTPGKIGIDYQGDLHMLDLDYPFSASAPYGAQLTTNSSKADYPGFSGATILLLLQSPPAILIVVFFMLGKLS